MPDYKILYEQEQVEKQQALELISDQNQFILHQDGQIASLTFELDKLRKYLFGSKSEKLPLIPSDSQQIELFDLGTSPAQQEELSQEAVTLVEKKPAKKREKGQGRSAAQTDDIAPYPSSGSDYY